MSISQMHGGAHADRGADGINAGGRQAAAGRHSPAGTPAAAGGKARTKACGKVIAARTTASSEQPRTTAQANAREGQAGLCNRQAGPSLYLSHPSTNFPHFSNSQKNQSTTVNRSTK